MAFSTEWRDNFCEGYDHGRLSGNARPQRVLGGAAVACVAFACACTLWVNLAGNRPAQVVEAEPKPATALRTDARLSLASNAYAKLAAALNSYARRAALSNSYARLFDSRYLGVPPGPFAKVAALQADSEPADPAAGEPPIEQTPDTAVTASIDRQAVQRKAAPAQPLRLPPARTASLREATHPSRTGSNTPAEKPTIFEKLFGKPAPLTLAYAAPDDGDLGGQSLTPGRFDRWTAVYDISARTVYMPDGTTLEAHSGYGNRLDDPRHTDERMRGATPATVYDLKLRESLFHGVQALRLIPEDEDKVFGRSGLLAHTYMLGPNGDSNGCVSFRDYNAFLQAYLNHRIKRIAVVTRLVPAGLPVPGRKSIGLQQKARILSQPFNGCCALGIAVMVARAFDTAIVDDGEALVGPWRTPQQMLAAQVYDGHVSIHDNAMAQKVGFKAATIEGPTHFSQFDPLCERLWGDAWFETGCISAHYRNAVFAGEEVQAVVLKPKQAQSQIDIRMVKRDGTEVLQGTASVGRDQSATALDKRLRDELKPLTDPVILRDVKVGMKTRRQTVRMDFDHYMGELYPFSLRDKLKVITEPSWLYQPDRAADNKWGRPIIPFEMLSVLFQYRSRDDRLPIKGPAVGLFADQEIRLLDGPLFAGESYELEREVVALSASRRTESLWARTSVFAPPTGRPVATMLLNLASIRESLPGYAKECAALYG